MRTLRIPLIAVALALAGALGLAVDASAAAAPTVTSTAATNVASNSATLNGTVNPNSSATQYAFQYGTTSGYGEETPLTDAGNGSTAAPASATPSDLIAGTKYHYRIIAISAAGTAAGADKTLTTTGTKPAGTAPGATTGAASDITTGGATVSGTVNPNGLATSYHFEYGTTSHLGYTTAEQSAAAASTTTGATANLTNLPPGRTIYYRLDAVSAAGVTPGSTKSFKTAMTATVTTGGATSITATGATLNGDVDPHGTATSYFFQYGTTGAYGSQTAIQNAGNGNSTVPASASVTGLRTGTTYHYRLVATGAGGTVYGADQTFVPSAGTSTLAVGGQLGFVSPGSPIVGVWVSCENGSTSCSGTLSLTRYVTISARHFSLRAGTAGFVHLTLSAHGLHLLHAWQAKHQLMPVNARISGTRIVHPLHLAEWTHNGSVSAHK